MKSSVAACAEARAFRHRSQQPLTENIRMKNAPAVDIAEELYESTPPLDATDSRFREYPHKILDRLRAENPVYQDRGLDRAVLTRADDIADVLADRSLSADPFKARPTAFARRGLAEAERGRYSLVFLDDPDHARLRGLVTQAFSARAVEAMRPRIITFANDLLDKLDAERPFDLISAYAAPLPILVIAAMLGIDDAQVEQFQQWSHDTKLFFNPKRTEDEHSTLWSAINNLNACLAEMIARRRRQSRNDLISALVAAESEGDRLVDFEIVDTCRALLVAGHITTTDLIGNGLVALLQHPDQLAALQADLSLWPAVIEEMLRYDAPVTSWNRQSLDDRLIGGCPVEAGQTVTSMLAAANHDPALHADPHSFDIHRTQQKHYSFGGGAHFCLGASLARLEVRIALTRLLYRFPKLRLVPEFELRRKSQPGFSGYEAIWLAAA
jgi:cytochrome P450